MPTCQLRRFLPSVHPFLILTNPDFDLFLYLFLSLFTSKPYLFGPSAHLIQVCPFSSLLWDFKSDTGVFETQVESTSGENRQGPLHATSRVCARAVLQGAASLQLFCSRRCSSLIMKILRHTNPLLFLRVQRTFTSEQGPLARQFRGRFNSQ